MAQHMLPEDTKPQATYTVTAIPAPYYTPPPKPPSRRDLRRMFGKLVAKRMVAARKQSASPVS